MGLLRWRETKIAMLHTPLRETAVNGYASAFGDTDPCIAFSGMKPSAAEIDVQSVDLVCAGTAAQARTRLEQQGR